MVRSYDLKAGGMEKHVNKLMDKFRKIEENEVRYQTLQVDDAEIVLVGFGSSARACKAALDMGRAEGIKVGFVRPITLWPFPMKLLSELASKAENFLVVEMNGGQMVEDVRLSIEGKAKISLHSRPSGGIPTGEEILEVAKKIMKN